MNGNLTILCCALKQGLSEEDIRCSWRNAVAIRARD